MLLDEIKNIQSSKKELRKFGLSVGGVFFVLGLVLFYFGRFNGYYLLALGGALIAFGAVVPSLLLPLQKVWMGLAVVMGWFMSRFIITIMYIFVLTPIALIGKAVGKRFIEVEIDPKARTYWKRCAPKGKGEYEKQF